MISRARIRALLGLLCPLMPGVMPASGAAPSPPRPNIVLILADDMGYSDIGCFGSEIATPNLDRLAAGGLRLDQFYTTPKCFPSRAALLTGLYPHQVGLGEKPLKLKNCATLAELLRGVGYHTWMVGKWHGEDMPVKRGFDHYYGLNDGAANHFNPGLRRPGEPEPAGNKWDRRWGIDDRIINPYTPEDPKFYSTDAYTNYALDYLSGQKDDRPFFLYVAYTAPHYPIQAWPEDIAKYRGRYLAGWDQIRLARHGRQQQMGFVTATAALTPRGNTALAPVRKTGPWMPRFWDDAGNILPWAMVPDHDKWDLKMAVYAAMVDRIDQNIGRLLAKLRELKKDENTLVIFLSDNGACAGTHHEGATAGDPAPSGPGPLDSFHTYDAPWADVSNAPTKGYKDTCYEGGLLSPAVFHWPKGLKPRGAIAHDVAHIMDIVPTCLELAGASYPAAFDGAPIPPVEGKSLVPFFRGQPRASHDLLCWEWSGNRAVRRGDWKLVAMRDKPWELFDLKTDRGEQRDLARAHPDIADDLVRSWESWGKRVGVVARPPRAKVN